MRVLVLGYGSVGKRHVHNLLALGQEVAVCDPGLAPAEWQKSGPVGAMLFTDRAAALEQSEAVVIAVPAALHVDLCWEAFEKGLPVFVEKPLATAINPTWEISAGQWDGPWPHMGQSWPNGERVVQVGYQLRAHIAARAFQDGMRTVGAPCSARFFVGSDKQNWPGMSYADALLEYSHEIDAALWLFGSGRCVGAGRVRDTWELVVEHDNGCLTSLHLSGDQHHYGRTWSVLCEHGSVGWSWGGQSLVALTRDGSEQLEILWQGDAIQANEEAYRDEMAWFIGAAERGLHVWANACTLEDALQVLAICDEARHRTAKKITSSPP